MCFLLVIKRDKSSAEKPAVLTFMPSFFFPLPSLLEHPEVPSV